jgi:hypothetical protein
MTTYNGSRNIRASINSILSQTWRDLELIVVDDCSTDDTAAILASYDDPRLKIMRNERNLNVVASRNRCLAQARGEFIALLDHDDLSAPTRLARQIDYFRANPDTVLLGTAANVLQNGQILEMNHPRGTTPGLILWLLHVANPLICSSVMFRASAARRLSVFMRDNYRYADDYDFYHRMAALGEIARLDEPLTLYRLHEGNTYKQQEETMAASAVKVLEPVYRRLFGDAALEAATLVVRHLSRGQPVADEQSLRRLCAVFDTLNRSFCEAPATDEGTRCALLRHAGVLWWRMLRATARQGGVGVDALLGCRPAGFHPKPLDRLHLMSDRLPMRGRIRDLLLSTHRLPALQVPPDVRLFGTTCEPRLPDPLGPPTLFVSVDTEAEFDWRQPFDRARISVSAIDDIERGQAIFDRYGLRPIYLVDFPVASQEQGYRRLRDIMERDGCEIGAHLHPWTTPPFEEVLSERNSFPGNLEPQLEERKLATLVTAIRQNFGTSPVFYKAGRYGLGPGTLAALVCHGFKVDLSILPGTDLRPVGGPDFRGFTPVPYELGGSKVISVPMTRAPVGRFPALGPIGQMVHVNPFGRWLRLPSALARLGLSETITLTPEGMTSEEQIRLLRALMARGYRQFMLHYHSPSLSPGHTPYVRDEAGAACLLDRLRQVCRFFFEDIGGLPGYPRDLLQNGRLAAGSDAKRAPVPAPIGL